MSDEVKSKRGRPRMPPEMQEQRKKERQKEAAEAHKKSEYAAQKKYRSKHAKEIYEPKIRLKAPYKPVLDQLLQETGMSITQLFVHSVEKEFDIKLHDDIDNDTQ